MNEFSSVDLSLDRRDGELSLTDDGALIRRSIIPGGIRVLTESVPHTHTVAIGMWVGTGSCDEAEDTLGSTHFLEHLLFKGTKRRSARDIAEKMDYLGGNINAGTDKQFTYYYGHVMRDDLADMVDLLGDMITSSSLDEEEMERERSVILEELAMYADDAPEVAYEKIAASVFGPHPLGRPIGGTRASVSGLAHESLLAHYQANYRPNELVVTAAGCVDHEELCSLVVEAVRRGGWTCEDGAEPAERRFRGGISYEAREASVEMAVEQAAVVVGMPAMTSDDERRYSLHALTTILGGGVSSRLFGEIRDRRGLAYTTYAYPSLYREGGLFLMYAGCSPKDASTVVSLMEECLEDVTKGVSDAEIESAYRRVRSDMAFGSESVTARMTKLGDAELLRGRLLSRSQRLRRARAVTGQDIAEVAAELASAARSRVVVGPAM
ncbi:MAG: pitrilysin family protein [Actinomycetaceae bacterium]|nr:pitrilysin family protein [Actinomycetaceae bacterium]